MKFDGLGRIHPHQLTLPENVATILESSKIR
jgi:hypothetical protein